MSEKRSLGPRTIAMPTPVWVIGAYDENERPNVMTASWAGVCCSAPPCVTVSLRRERYTFGCISTHRAFTVNVPSVRYAREADFFGIASGRDHDKLALAGLTAVPATTVHAPCVAEFPLVLECRVVETVDLGSHTQFVGEIMDVKADEDVLDPRGLPAVDRVQPFVFAPELRRYNAVGAEIGAGYAIGRELMPSE